MSTDGGDFNEALSRAKEHALSWLASVETRPVGPQKSVDQLAADFGGPLQEAPIPPAEVVDELARLADPGLMAMPSGRFFGWVIGGTLPAALGADWLVSAWDQNSAMRYATPATAAIEETAARWIVDLFGFPARSGVGFTTGATMANFVGLASAREKVLADVGHDLNADGLAGAPRITVIVGEERHASVDLALRYLGLGKPVVVPADDEGRTHVGAFAEVLSGIRGPVIVCLQAGNLHSGAFDPFDEIVTLAHERGAWVHVDGAFGLWAGISPRFDALTRGMVRADSWATDAHKTLNVPYDCGVVIVAHPDVLHSAFGTSTSYLIRDDAGSSDPFERVPEMSRRARAVPVWAALRSLGRVGTVELVDRLVDTAQALARGLAALPGVEVLNEVVFTQVCLSFGSDERTRLVTQRLIDDGDVWMSGSRWHGRDILRISVSNWSTDADDIARSIEAVERASGEAAGGAAAAVPGA
ncbi:aspartate aminotransferase family protein [Subtercola boreus]|uniref:Aspartate aminotransferase family protein n=1 Tax=Subtercola boreus TaxID=120213 RepID=A0A3E0W5T9_9MICO|nr:aminotransferase class V-fold PLP-dependent enzyme [Subtercola boreus]RFA17165.1 aspartate aminotransferase family protein [Subtercola boreus]